MNGPRTHLLHGLCAFDRLCLEPFPQAAIRFTPGLLQVSCVFQKLRKTVPNQKLSQSQGEVEREKKRTETGYLNFEEAS